MPESKARHTPMLYKLKIAWAIVSGLLMPGLLIGITVPTDATALVGSAAGFVVAAVIPFLTRLSVIARLCLVWAVISTGLLFDDPYRWPDGLFITLGLTLLMFVVLKRLFRMPSKQNTQRV